jgi:hypothetical protein
VELIMDLVDAQGLLFGDSETIRASDPDTDTGNLFGDDEDDQQDDDPDDEEQLLSHLVDCHGIIYLFDPVREAQKGDAFRYFERMLLRLTQRVKERNGLLPDTHLPHHLAVCVTKFDEPEVFRKARRGGFLETDLESEALLPRVTEERAKEFFRHLCSNGPGNADLVVRGIERYFHPDRVGYFVTSAVGFWIGPTRRFQNADFRNVIRQAEGRSRVRGKLQPLNVLEPLLWLERKIRTTSAPSSR